jgi:hypothetical protein
MKPDIITVLISMLMLISGCFIGSAWTQSISDENDTATYSWMGYVRPEAGYQGDSSSAPSGITSGYHAYYYDDSTSRFSITTNPEVISGSDFIMSFPSAVTCEVKPHDLVGSTLGELGLESDPVGSSTIGELESTFWTRYTTEQVYPHHDQTVHFASGYCAEILVDGKTVWKRGVE